VDVPVDVLGIDIGGTRTKWVHWSAEYGVLAYDELATPQSGALLDVVAGLIEDAKVSAAGVAVPGRLSDDLRRIELLPNLSGDWAAVPFADELEARTGASVRLVNDARAFALAELRIGAALGVDDALFVTMGTGIGGALALNGRVLRARGDAVGELGHIVCNPGGEHCGCGARGCLETVAGGWALVALARSRGAQATTPEDLVRAAAANDGRDAAVAAGEDGADAAVAVGGADAAVAREVLLEAGRGLGFVLGNVVAYTGVTTVVIGGGVAPAVRFMRPAIDAELAGRRRLVGPVELRLAELGSGAGAIGAAMTARDGEHLR
jgi:glucokinase